ncbi:MAG: hypothetical protein ACW96X_10975, partial [Promethearchaeota archaeon]
MSLDELISIERVEFERSKERIQETYVIADLKLSKLFVEVIHEIDLDILPLLDIKILLYVLNSVPFTNEAEGVNIVEGLKGCIENQLYGKSPEWKCIIIANEIKRLRSLVKYDYVVEGSLKLSS